MALSQYEHAMLRLATYAMLSGNQWGHVREDGKWKKWDGAEIKDHAQGYIEWALADGRSCAFCNKDKSAVRKMVAGPTVFICNECIDLCHSIIHEQIEPVSAQGIVTRRAETAEQAPGAERVEPGPKDAPVPSIGPVNRKGETE